MLKKTGIIVAASATALLALTGLAFAGDDNRSPECNSAPQGVNNEIPQNASGVASPLVGILGTAANVAAPVTAQTQAPIGSCNNIEDVLDVNVEDNFQDNSSVTSDEANSIDDSFNETTVED